MGRLPDCGAIFDRVLLDAPCSCEGRIGEDPESLRLWKPARVRRCSQLQGRLIENCYALLAPGGVLVYSTCTLAPEENEGIVDGLLKGHGEAEIEEVGGDWRRAPGLTAWGDTEYDTRVARCVRLYPHHHGTQGFFTAVIRRCR